jgi:predicted nucleic acid-binding protein
MALIVDTNALSAWLDGDPEIKPKLAQARSLSLSAIVLGEYVFGISGSRHHKVYEARLKSLMADFPVLVVDSTTASHYAAIRRELKLAGTPIPWHDIWIAAQARQHGMPILSRDSHFDEVKGVTRQGW